MALRVVRPTLVALPAALFVLHLFEAPTDQSFFPSGLPRQLEWAILFLVLCAAILIPVEVAAFIASRVQH
jgi:hypothetical protein